MKIPPGWRRTARRGRTAIVVVGAAFGTYQHRSQISSAGRMFGHLRVGWLLVAVATEMASMAVFARLQRWLLRAGGVDVPQVQLLEITLAGNAMSTSLPGGAAWAATWAFGQLRRRGANRLLSGWVILVAGALSSFAIFIVVAGGAWVAGGHGPVARLRWLAALLGAIPVLIALGYDAARRSARFRHILSTSWEALSARSSFARRLGRFIRRTIDNVGLVHPGAAGWAEAFALALVNWLLDAVCLAACVEALGLPVPWRAILVIYGLTQISASLPVTPGGLGVVEGSMTALLVAYGSRPTSAVAVVLLYRIVSFWALVPIGWAAWFGLELAHRGGLRRRAHPWATHEHGPEGLVPAAPLGPERILRPQPCTDCPDAADPLTPEQQVRERQLAAGRPSSTSA